MINYEESFKVGDSAEQRFSSHLLCPVFSTRQQDMEQHWDVEDGNGYRYDVKAMKKWRRSDSEPTDRMHFVEIRNVRGELGWAYGEADFIVFETRAYWIVVDRKRLALHVEEMTQSNQASQKPEVYKLYRRKGRKDLMTVVPTVDLLAISKQTIRK